MFWNIVYWAFLIYFSLRIVKSKKMPTSSVFLVAPALMFGWWIAGKIIGGIFSILIVALVIYVVWEILFSGHSERSN